MEYRKDRGYEVPSKKKKNTQKKEENIEPQEKYEMLHIQFASTNFHFWVQKSCSLKIIEV